MIILLEMRAFMNLEKGSEKRLFYSQINSQLYNNSDTIVQTGHQPLFYHPGIIIKNLILNKIGMMEGINAINLIVDTDTPPHIPLMTSPSPPSEGGDKGEVKGGNRWGGGV